MDDRTDSYLKVKLRSTVQNLQVAFDVTPDVIENRNINYRTLEPLHMPGGIHVFANSSSRTYSINNIKLISRTREEATKNMYKLNILRSWTVPAFGKSTARENRGRNRAQLLTQGGQAETRLRKKTANSREILGAPPEVLFLSAYSEWPFQHGNIYKIPIVITNLSIPYPSDVDYIPTAEGRSVNARYRWVHANVPIPTILTIDIQAMETHSPREYTAFSLNDYKNGWLKHF